jgi:CRISPR type III-A-associated RAMP protein Csm5
MSKVKIETLTPVHVGSGNLLYYNSDFIEEKIDDEVYLVVISEDKIGKLLGNTGEQFINIWLETIARKGDIREFIAKFYSDVKPDDYAKRKILSFASINTNDTLKEIIHNGMGLPYIPGSSLKGAIRTAILASLANNIRNKELLIENDRRAPAKQIEQQLFGRDPNSDVFRFIHAGDAYFEKDTEIAMRMINLNITEKDSLMDKSKPQLVEAIGQESESEFQLKIAKQYFDFVKPKYRELGNLPVDNINDLFSLINAHTRKLVEEEIKFWENIDKDNGEDYVSEMRNILEKINACEEGKSCVLRLGHASGWRFITGAWTETLMNFEDTVVPASRPGNNRYEEYDFPKTRRLDEDSFVLGFVKLTVTQK